MGLDLRMSLSLFLNIYISSLIFLIVFHVIFFGPWYPGLVSRMAEEKSDMLIIIQDCAVEQQEVKRFVTTMSWN
uniref:Uncharacterized protein n=1 Tax=Oryza rufipogon TaxID=4529 RepID=A0A0E0Q3V3_ORYRU